MADRLTQRGRETQREIERARDGEPERESYGIEVVFWEVGSNNITIAISLGRAFISFMSTQV